MTEFMKVFLVVSFAVSLVGCSDSSDDPTPMDCLATETACGSECCDNATQECVDSACVAKSTCDPATETACGSECCDNATQECVDSVCVAMIMCDPATETACGSECCDNATQECVDSACVAKSACDPATETACGSECCDNATQECVDSACVAKSTCDPATETACGSECCDNATQECVDSVCVAMIMCDPATEVTCGSGCCDSSAQVCDQSSHACEKSCRIDESIARVTVDEELEVAVQLGMQLRGQIPSTDGSLDLIVLELFNGYGVFEDGIAPGSYVIAGDELKYATCGLCIMLYADVDDDTDEAMASYMITGGAVEISEVEDGLVATLTNAAFGQVVMGEDSEEIPHPVGCTAAIAEVVFNGRLYTSCNPIASDCPGGESCYFSWNYWEYVCLPAGSGEMGSACENDDECGPGLGCHGGNFDECSPFCDPALVDPGCPPANPVCEDWGLFGTCVIEY